MPSFVDISIFFVDFTKSKCDEKNPAKIHVKLQWNNIHLLFCHFSCKCDKNIIHLSSISLADNVHDKCITDTQCLMCSWDVINSYVAEKKITTHCLTIINVNLSSLNGLFHLRKKYTLMKIHQLITSFCNGTNGLKIHQT